MNGVSTAGKCRRQECFRTSDRLLWGDFAQIHVWQRTPQVILAVGSVNRNVNDARFRDSSGPRFVIVSPIFMRLS